MFIGDDSTLHLHPSVKCLREFEGFFFSLFFSLFYEGQYFFLFFPIFFSFFHLSNLFCNDTCVLMAADQKCSIRIPVSRTWFKHLEQDEL